MVEVNKKIDHSRRIIHPPYGPYTLVYLYNLHLAEAYMIGYIRYMSLPSANKAVHFGFETHRRCYQNSKKGDQWSHKNDLCHPKREFLAADWSMQNYLSAVGCVNSFVLDTLLVDMDYLMLLLSQIGKGVQTDKYLFQYMDLGNLSAACITQPSTCSSDGGTVSLWVKILEDTGYIITSRSPPSEGFSVHSTGPQLMSVIRWLNYT